MKEGHFMKKRLPLILLIILLLVLAVVGGIFYYLSGKTKFNESYVNGNTAGNLYNGGLFCEYGDIIYFANPSDGDTLYSMNADGSNLTKLCSDIVSYINVDDNYIYYIRDNPGSDGDEFSFLKINTNSLCRMDRTKGADSVMVLDTEPSLYASLLGNYVYYIHYGENDGSTLYKVKIDGSEQQRVEEEPYYTCSANGQYLYFNGRTRDHYIWRMNTEDDSKGILYGGNCWMPTVTDNESTAYFMDCDNNYTLAKVDLATQKKTTLCEDRIDWYNVYGSYIFFQTSDETSPALCRIRTDGTGYEVISEGNHKNINVTSDYTYFRDFNTDQMFRIANTVGADVEVFDPGKVTDK